MRRGPTGGFISVFFPGQGPAFLTFNIGSVDSFERNLEQAQRELSINAANQLPVTYVSEADWFKELLKLSPTLLILGAIIFFSRRLASGASGRGVSDISSFFPSVCHHLLLFLYSGYLWSQPVHSQDDQQGDQHQDKV